MTALLKSLNTATFQTRAGVHGIVWNDVRPGYLYRSSSRRCTVEKRVLSSNPVLSHWHNQ